MGLDMYLYAKLYISKYTNKELNPKIEEVRRIFPEMFISDNLNTIILKFEAGYWRKANHIHNWFVEKVQGGEDECNPYEVSREQLEELKKDCEIVVKSKKQAKEILPTKDGFFFGETEYSKDYFQDCKETIKIIDKCLALPECWDFEYRSSW